MKFFLLVAVCWLDILDVAKEEVDVVLAEILEDDGVLCSPEAYKFDEFYINQLFGEASI